MTLKEFNDTIEIMRTVYDFADEDTKLVTTRDAASLKNDRIVLATIDKETDTCVTLERKCEESEVREPWRGE